MRRPGRHRPDQVVAMRRTAWSPSPECAPLSVNSGPAKQNDRPKAASGLRTSQSSNVPRRNSSPTTSVAAAVVTSVNAAFGNCSQTARSSAVTVSHPNLNMYRPGSVTRPTCAKVTLLTANHFPFAFTFLKSMQKLHHRAAGSSWRSLGAFGVICAPSAPTANRSLQAQ